MIPNITQIAAVSVSIIDLLTSLTTAFILGLWAVFTYRLTHRGLTYERSFLVTIVMIGPIVGVVIMLIGSNLALSLGLVGALSIIRFRNVIKDTRDMVYLFWAIAIGLGAGTFSWVIVIISSIFVGLVLMLFHLFHYGEAQHDEFVCVVAGDGNELTDNVTKTISSMTQSFTVRSMKIDNGNHEIVCEIKFPKNGKVSAHEILVALQELPGVRHTSLLSPRLSLPI